MCVSRFHVRNPRSHKVMRILIQDEVRAAREFAGPFLTAWLHSPIYARQTAHSPDERPVVG